MLKLASLYIPQQKAAVYLYEDSGDFVLARYEERTDRFITGYLSKSGAFAFSSRDDVFVENRERYEELFD